MVPVSTLPSELRWSSEAHSVAEADALLTRLWSSAEARRSLAASDSGAKQIAVRTGVMNLVVVATGEERGIHAAATLQTLPRSPSRTLFIVPRDPGGPADFRGRLEVFCAVTPRGDGTSACTELLRIDVSGRAARHLSSIVSPLSLHDLPTLLWWDAPIDATSDDLRQMLRGVDRVMIDGTTQLGSGLVTLKGLVEATSRAGVALSDFSLIRQSRWRDAIATTFDEPLVAPFLDAIDDVTVTYAGAPEGRGPVNIVKPLYHVAWLASRLGYMVIAPLRETASGWGAILADRSGHAIQASLRSRTTAVHPGTTLGVVLHAQRRGSELTLEMDATDQQVRARAAVSGSDVRERHFEAARATEASLLGDSLEFGEIDPLAPAILRKALELIG